MSIKRKVPIFGVKGPRAPHYMPLLLNCKSGRNIRNDLPLWEIYTRVFEKSFLEQMLPGGPHGARVAPHHQPTGPVKALEGRTTSGEAATSHEAAARGYPGTSKAGDVHTADGDAVQKLLPELAGPPYINDMLIQCA